MITYLEGVIDEKQPTRLVMDLGGVGYEVLIPLSTYDRLPSVGESCRVLTYDYVREDAHQLFGFMTEDDRNMFLLLMGISGIGPKLALSALSGLTIRELRAAIVEGDVKRLSSISGVGKKMAERMVVELRDKIGEGEALDALASMEDGDLDDAVARDSMMALVALGYQQSAARKMVMTVLKKSDGISSVEEIIKKALGG